MNPEQWLCEFRHIWNINPEFSFVCCICMYDRETTGSKKLFIFTPVIMANLY